MKLLVMVLSFSALSFAQPAPASPQMATLLNFERDQTPGALPSGWSGSTSTVTADDKVVHSGKWSAKIERDAKSMNQYSTLTGSTPIDFKGSRIEWRGYIRSDQVSGFVALWTRQDGDKGMIAIKSMEDQKVEGTFDWKQFSIEYPLDGDATQLFFGFLLSGTGKAWVDDLELLVDGKPVWEAPKKPKEITVLDTDHEFDGGSKISFEALSKQQIANLQTLGKVWGFLKYHHPKVATGGVHWDYELFRVLPSLLKAESSEAAQSEMNKWIVALGEISPCSPCADSPAKDAHLRPKLDWVSSLNADLRASLQASYKNRPAKSKQFYLSKIPGVGNPKFENEPNYPNLKIPDNGYQLLALYRFWSIVEYWFPYRDVIGEDWDKVLLEFIPRVTLAKNKDEYQLELMALIARIHDTHANLWSSIQVRPPVGKCQLPIHVRFVEGKAVVAGQIGSETPLRVGDVIESLDGAAVSELVQRWTPVYAASNDPTRLRDIGRALTRGDCEGTAALRVRRGTEQLDLKLTRVTVKQQDMNLRHDVPGAFRKISDDIAYLNLMEIKRGDVKKYMDSASGAKGLVIDARNYPGDFPIFDVGSHLVESKTPFVNFTSGDLNNPGAFQFGPPLSLTPGSQRFTGKVVILVDEVTQSSAEYHSMAWRSAPGAVVMGSTTAGADGNVSPIPLPGGLRSMISGIGVFYPDKRPTQRVGIVPDVEVKPTIAGIAAGRDEVLERALRHILGPDADQATIEKLARH